MKQPDHPTIDDWAAGDIDEFDLLALHRTRQLFDRLDPVPGDLVNRIQFGLTLDALEAELAELQRSGDLVGIRSDGDGEVQTVTFTSSSLSTMVSVSAMSADRVRIDGWVAPGGGVEVELRVVGRALSAVADSDGRFVFEDVPRGLAQFVLRTPVTGSRPVVTPSIEI